ncbi:hypothetical protein PGB90_007656 [Kerria lacca]
MNDKIIPISFFTIFLTLSIIELLNDSPFLEKEIPETKMSLTHSTAPTITIQYCHSCGYQKAFMEYASILQQKYPEFRINGEYYEANGFNTFLAKLLNLSRMAFIILIILEKNIFGLFHVREPSWWIWCLNNKIYACLVIFFFSNMIENMLISSGAFEISMNGVPLWSKIESGRVPQPQELFRIIDSQMNFETTLNYNTQFPK